MKPKSSTKTAAVVTITDAPNMSKRGRTDIALWLCRQADFLKNHNTELARRYQARYEYRP